jgi:peptidoglycan hydrolase-like protein with peptidoglycan-binding domain
MNISLASRVGLGLGTVGLVCAAATAQERAPKDAEAAKAAAPAKSADPGDKPGAAAKPDVDLTVLHVQVLLDHLGFAPGVIDGKGGMSLKGALRGFQEARGLKVTGIADQATLEALHPYRAIRPVRVLTVSEGDAVGPYQGPLPKEPAEQAKLPALGYADAVEKLAEKFHTTPATLVALNAPGADDPPGRAAAFPQCAAVVARL